MSIDDDKEEMTFEKCSNKIYFFQTGIPFLKNTRLFLAPIPILILFYIITIIIGWNICISFVNFFHFYRVL